MDTVEEEEKYETFSSKKSNVGTESRPDAIIEDNQILNDILPLTQSQAGASKYSCLI